MIWIPLTYHLEHFDGALSVPITRANRCETSIGLDGRGICLAQSLVQFLGEQEIVLVKGGPGGQLDCHGKLVIEAKCVLGRLVGGIAVAQQAVTLPDQRMGQRIGWCKQQRCGRVGAGGACISRAKEEVCKCQVRIQVLGIQFEDLSVGAFGFLDVIQLDCALSQSPEIVGSLRVFTDGIHILYTGAGEFPICEKGLGVSGVLLTGGFFAVLWFAKPLSQVPDCDAAALGDASPQECQKKADDNVAWQ